MVIFRPKIITVASETGFTLVCSRQKFHLASRPGVLSPTAEACSYQRANAQSYPPPTLVPSDFKHQGVKKERAYIDTRS
jgi:hypothetical protein